MALILAIQSDSEQAALLLETLHELPDVEIALVDSTDAALQVLDERVPDVVLVHPLTDPADEEHLAAYLGVHPLATHVQMLTMPLLGTARRLSREKVNGTASRCGTVASTAHALAERVTCTAVWMRPPVTHALHRFAGRVTATAGWTPPTACDPRAFGADLVVYLSRADALKREIDDQRAAGPRTDLDRRRAPRFSPDDLPWVAAVCTPDGDLATLVDFSSGGALLHTKQRPGRASFRSWFRERGGGPDLTLRMQSGEEVRIAGQVIRCVTTASRRSVGLYEVAFRFDNPVDPYHPAIAQPDSNALAVLAPSSPEVAFERSRGAQV